MSLSGKKTDTYQLNTTGLEIGTASENSESLTKAGEYQLERKAISCYCPKNN